MLRLASLIEKVIILLLVVVVVVYSTRVYGTFKNEFAQASPDHGGVFTEGVVGRITGLNPLFARTLVDRDISRLIFSGLTKYNPISGEIEGDMASYKLSDDKKTYTFVLKNNLFWHDGEPVTVDDVVYTYKIVLQSPSFQNKSLQDAFKDIDIQRISDREVIFRLPQPYAFFLSNVTLGILPKHVLNFVPVEDLAVADFNLKPIGSGPFMFESLENEAGGVSRIVLKSFDTYHFNRSYIDSFVFRIFPTFNDLKPFINSFTAVRIPPGESDFSIDDRFKVIEYTLPQYVAVFLNTQSDILSRSKTRFAFLLATDKQTLINSMMGKREVVDTPVLEAKDNLDIEYNEERAKGAFFDTEWKLRKQEPKIVSADGFSLVIEANKDTWLKLKIDGVESENSLLKEGEKRRFSFKNMFDFVNVDNAGGIKFFIDDQEGKLLGLDGEVIKDFAIQGTNVNSVLVAPYVAPKKPFAEKIADEVSAVVEPKNTEPVVYEEGKTIYRVFPDSSEIRYDEKDNPLRLRLITASSPQEYVDAALELQKEWLKAGVDLIVEAYDTELLQSKIRDRDYDLLLFGQNLGYNLDAYPFWHSSQAANGLNLSQYKSIEADNLLVKVRSSFNTSTKGQLLGELKKEVAKDTPAVFLYTPVYKYLIDRKAQGLELNHLALDSDRFNMIQSVYLREKQVLSKDVGFRQFFTWILTNL